MQNEKSVGALFTNLSRDVLNLMRQEIELAKVEIAIKAEKAARHSLLIAFGGGFAFAALIIFLIGVTTAISEHFSILISSIIVAIFVGNAGLLFIAIGFFKLRRDDFMPHKTIEVVREEGEWIKEETAA